MKIRLVQFQPLHDKEKNRATALKLAQSPGLVDTDILVFPELFTTGYQLENIERLAEPLEGETFQHFQALAQEYQVSIVLGSLATRQNTHLYNNTVILSPTGDLLGSYSKIHLFRLMKEEQYFSAGRTLGLFSWGETLCGVLICYDLRFPELARSLALQGAQVLFVPMEWPAPRTPIFQTLLRARAIENQCYVVGVNVCGSGLQKDIFFEGRSMVVDPYGTVLGELEAQEGVLDVEIDLARVEKCRQSIPCFEDRQADLYFV